jgi:chromosome partitioning protein
MPTFITTAHQKGGVGKSTIALNLYGYFTKAGLKTAIVDIDPQGTITQFSELAEAGRFNLIKRRDFVVSEEDDRISIERLLVQVKDYDVVIIDTPPYLTDELEDIFQITNLLIIPCKASLFDALAIRQTLAFIENSKRANDKNFISVIVLTMVISGSNIQDQIREVLKQHKTPILDTEIGNRIAYAKSLLLTGSIVDDDTGKAKDEIENLATEILTLISKK